MEYDKEAILAVFYFVIIFVYNLVPRTSCKELSLSESIEVLLI